MPRIRTDGPPPNWQALCEIAMSQGGFFTLAQAAEAGYSPQLVQHYLRGARLQREHRAIYRLAQYPRGDHDDLIVDWLWSGFQGVLSHDTALALHRLSDILPPRRHLSVPAAWRRRKLSVPKGLVLHFGLPTEADREWYGCVPVTRPVRTFLDCQAANLAPDLLEQARREGISRGLFTESQLRAASSAKAARS